MIRVFFIVAAFFAVTIALILVQPSKPRRSADHAAPGITDVTRSGTDLSSLATFAPAQAEPEAVELPPETPRIVMPTEVTVRPVRPPRSRTANRGGTCHGPVYPRRAHGS